MVQGAGLELEQLLLQQARDLHLGLLDGQLLRALNGQEQLPVTLRNRLAGPVICSCTREDNLMTCHKPLKSLTLFLSSVPM